MLATLNSCVTQQKFVREFQLFISFQFGSNIVCRVMFSFLFVAIEHSVFMIMQVFYIYDVDKQNFVNHVE